MSTAQYERRILRAADPRRGVRTWAVLNEVAMVRRRGVSGGVLMLVAAFSTSLATAHPSASAQELDVRMEVEESVVANGYSYRYRVINDSDLPITSIMLGWDDNDAYLGSEPVAMPSPAGWTAEFVVGSEGLTGSALEWTSQSASIGQAEVKEGFEAILDGPDPTYRTAPFMVTFEGGIEYVGKLVPLTGTEDRQGPTIVLTEPTPDAVVNGFAVQLRAEASDPSGVASVTFRAAGREHPLDDPVRQVPFEAVWALAPTGTHSLVAVAVDAYGNSSTSAPVTITVENSDAPTATIQRPVEGEVITGPVTLRAVLEGPPPIGASVGFMVDGQPVGHPVNHPFEQVWDPAAVSDGPHVVSADLFSIPGGSSSAGSRTVTVDVRPPEVSILTPAAEVAVEGIVQVGVEATDTTGVAWVEFEVDGQRQPGRDDTAPFEFEWDSRLWPNGRHTITAVAEDSLGRVGVSAPHPIVVANP